jgi:hypothetical protein
MDFIERLLDLGASINFRNEKQWNSILSAAYVGDTELISLLMQNGADGTVGFFSTLCYLSYLSLCSLLNSQAYSLIGLGYIFNKNISVALLLFS